MLICLPPLETRKEATGKASESSASVEDVIKTNWSEVIFRFDLRFRKPGKDFGYWIIKSGGRY